MLTYHRVCVDSEVLQEPLMRQEGRNCYAIIMCFIGFEVLEEAPIRPNIIRTLKSYDTIMCFFDDEVPEEAQMSPEH